MFSVRIIALLFILQQAQPLKIALVRLAIEEATIPCSLLSPQHSANSEQNFLVWNM
jgi:hypothetical protein